MAQSDIVVRGARQHNLRDVTLQLPRNKLICFSGVSGSGKSSLAFDTLFAEGQRRYIESLSTYARQFLGQLPKPDVDYIGGLSPSIAISQKSAGNNPRSTVGTITEIQDYLRILYARVGTGHCPSCGEPIAAQSREQIIQRILQFPPDTTVLLLAPLVRGQKGEYRDLFADLLKQGLVRARVDGQVVSLSDDLRLDRQMRHDIEVVIDRVPIQAKQRPRIAEAVELGLRLGQGTLLVVEQTTGRRKGSELVLSVDYACARCGVGFAPPSPQLFSFNSPQGMCPTCGGLGDVVSFDPERLIPDPSKSLQQGCIEVLGPLRELGRTQRCMFQGVASTMERKWGLPPRTLLQTRWDQLEPRLQAMWLWGTGDEHITMTWRNGRQPIRFGGTFDGIIPWLLDRYRSSRSLPQRRYLEKYMATMGCPECHGGRLNRQASAFTVTTAHPDWTDGRSLTLPELCRLPVGRAAQFFRQLELDEVGQRVAEEVLKEIRGRLNFLIQVGLEYLTLDRTAPTLSGGEAQRIRLAGQIGSGLVGVLYILDEPSIGLHPRDNQKLLGMLQRLRDQGNTVVVVEHDEDTMRAADWVVDFGPGPGVRGGRVVAQGPLSQVVRAPRSLTGQYLSGRRKIATPDQRRIPPRTAPPPPSPQPRPAASRRRRRSASPNGQPPASNWLSILGAAHNNLKGIDVHIPLGAFVCVTGVSGSGKSSLVNDILMEVLRRDLNGGNGTPGAHRGIAGLEHLDKMIAIDQSPIGRTPRSNPATYIKVFDDIRRLFVRLPESRRRGFPPGRFSFNVSGGRCEACGGNGSTRLEMDFLADVWVTCPVCEGHRFNRETLAITFHGKNISDVLEMDVQQAMELFKNQPKIQSKLQTLHDVGLDYLKLGQPSPTLSGGEAQRIKLARELVKTSTGQTLYVLDEPTTGLHFADIDLLLKVLHGFVDAGNTVLVVEHNLDVIKTADWVIDLGPEAGEAGGELVAAGTPEEISRVRHSHTGRALAEVLGGRQRRSLRRPARAPKSLNGSAKRLIVHGAQQHNLKHVDLAIDRHRMTVFCGPSGSGKTSLAMDTIYAEGQRRYVESLSAYARQFVSQVQKPRVEAIEGLSPSIAIQQQNLGHSPRSTVGTSTEIYDYLRVLWARLATPYCPRCDRPIGTQTADQITDKILEYPEGTRLYLMAPRSVEVGQKYEALWTELRTAGYSRVRIDGVTHSLDDPPTLDRRRKHDVAILVDRVVVRPANRTRIAQSVETALAEGRGVVQLAEVVEGKPEERWPVSIHSQHLACEGCGRSFVPLSPHNFSFNSPLGWCPACQGLGVQIGTHPGLLLRSGMLTLADGALLLWPDLQRSTARSMLEALARDARIPLDVPFDELDARSRRLIMQGTGDEWHQAVLPDGRGGERPFRFQFKGLYPALEEASRLHPGLRQRLQHLVDEVDCMECGGGRLRDDAAAARLYGLTLDQACRLSLGQLSQAVDQWKLDRRQRRIAGELIREIRSRLKFLQDVGLEYLTLARPASTLSGGEAQRIRLARQLGSGLCGVLYVLDEPTIGLHPRDNHRLLGALHGLRDLGNTLVVVEHDREIITGSDRLVDFGPGAGRFGGQIVAQGTTRQVARRTSSITGPYLSGAKAIPVPTNRRLATWTGSAGDGRPSSGSRKNGTSRRSGALDPVCPLPDIQRLEILGARQHNLKGVDVAIPLGALTAITGVSGSGKSSLVEDVLYATLARRLHRASTIPGAHDRIAGVEHINKVIRVDQQPLGNSPSSNPATFTGVFELMRALYAQLPEARVRGYTARRFSFNVPGGRCEECEGNGQRCIEMHFLPDVWVTCEACGGKRYTEETLAVRYHGRSIADALEMTCAEALELFGDLPRIRRILQTLCDVGLGYLALGQPAPALSGGEAQRVKLAAELARPDTGRTLYLLDEPTTGLHFDDLRKLLDVLHRLVDLGNTVVVIEHNLDVIKTADWVIDLGPEAGQEGGWVVAAGTPEHLATYAGQWKEPARRRSSASARKPAAPHRRRSYTGEALIDVLQQGPHEPWTRYQREPREETKPNDREIAQIGRDTQMPWQVDGRRWHTRTRIGHDGQPCRWDGKILAELVDRIQEMGAFAPTNWNARSVVEITSPRKGLSWFLHAMTGETWLLRLRFRVRRNTFRADDLQQQLPLKPLNDLYDVPLYGNEPRVKVRQRGPLQEVELRVYSWDEINREEFWEFLEQAVGSYQQLVEHAEANPEDIMPWRKLGEKWHFSRRGFPPSQPPRWNTDVLQELCDILRQAAPDAQFLWNNQQVVHLFVPQQRDAWASIYTKKTAAVELTLTGPKNQFGMGRVVDVGWEPELETGGRRYDVFKFKFRSIEELYRGDFTAFAAEHYQRLDGSLAARS